MQQAICSVNARRRPPFTLIELLVVILIMLILFSLLLPALHLARAAGHSAVCVNQLAQFGKIKGMYTSDENTFFPGPQPSVYDNPPPSTATAATVNRWWQIYHAGGYYEPVTETADLTYSLDIAINWCPSDPDFRIDTSSGGQKVFQEISFNNAESLGIPTAQGAFFSGGFPSKWEVHGSTYGVFYQLRPWAPSDADDGNGRKWSPSGLDNILKFFGTSRSLVESPEVIPYLADSRHVSLPGTLDNNGHMATPFYGMAVRHGAGSYLDGAGSANILFHDGHVEGRGSNYINQDWSVTAQMGGVIITDGFGGNTYLRLKKHGIVWKGGGITGGSYDNLGDTIEDRYGIPTYGTFPY